MQFSVKSSSSLFWKTDFTEARIMSDVQCGRISGDWLVCPLGKATHAVTIAEFIENPSILIESDEIAGELSSDQENLPQGPMSVAALGWWVFFGALTAHFVLGAILIDGAGRLDSTLGALFAASLLKGTDALVIAGAITALLGHAYHKVAKK